MTTTTIEQFREQCTDTVFENKKQSHSLYDIDLYANGWNAAIDESIRAINAIPLPVIPEQAEPEGLTDKWLQDMMNRNFMINGGKTECELLRFFAFRVLQKFGSAEGAHKAFTHWYESDTKKQNDDLKQAAVAANARIAELEAEIQKLKEGK